MKKVMLVFGTRPEAVKMCPLVIELKRRKSFDVVVCVSGQHKEMLQEVLDIFGVIPDYNLAIMKENQNLFDITVNILGSIREVLSKEKPDIVLVHGDTTTAFATALACFYMKIPIGHVEAGLRTYNIDSPYPEEINRQFISLVAKYNFVPTGLAQKNLLTEKKNPASIFVTGNTVIDAMKTTIKKQYSNLVLEWAGESRLILLTAHRRENIGDPMRNIFRAINRITSENSNVRVVYPIHMNPAVRKICSEILAGNPQVKIIEPLNVVDFHNMMDRSYLIVTDSGGIQEEAPALGKPVIVCRDTTERPEGVAAGTLLLAGTKEESIYCAVNTLLHDQNEYSKMSKADNPYGDGYACRRIGNILEFGEMNYKKIIVSLTSYPDRIQTVYKVIESLFAQTRKADEIVLWLSVQEFPEKELDLPMNLKGMIDRDNFRIEWVHDNLKSHKKYFYALQNNKDSIVITVDDDKYYEEHMICTLMESYQKHPHAVSARNVHQIFKDKNKITDYISWRGTPEEFVGTERMDLCAIGASGILYPPGCGKERWFDKDTIKNFGENQDDLWLKYNEIIDEIPVVYTGMAGEDITIEETQTSALYLKNVSGGDNDICMEKLMGLMQERHAAIYREWLYGLTEIRENMEEEIRHYSLELDKLFHAYGNEKIYICGAGKYAGRLIKFIKGCEKEKYIKAFLVSDIAQNETTIDGIAVKEIKDLDEKEPCIVICGISERNVKVFREMLDTHESCQWLDVGISEIARLMWLEEKYGNKQTE